MSDPIYSESTYRNGEIVNALAVLNHELVGHALANNTIVGTGTGLNSEIRGMIAENAMLRELGLKTRDFYWGGQSFRDLPAHKANVNAHITWKNDKPAEIKYYKGVVGYDSNNNIVERTRTKIIGSAQRVGDPGWPK